MPVHSRPAVISVPKKTLYGGARNLEAGVDIHDCFHPDRLARAGLDDLVPASGLGVWGLGFGV